MKKSMSILSILISGLIFLNLFTAPVSAKDEAENNTNNEKVIYLTFDDGPGGKVTIEVLDILKKENVPATFFLIGDQIKGQEETLKRMHEEGHSLGLHSMTHKKSTLYSSNEAFLKEMLDDQKTINDAVGISPTILRFPFGCNNTRYHLKKELVDLLHENHLKIYDWNVDTTDGANHNASPSTYIKNAKSDKETVMLLMHCGYMNKNSAKALPEIIKYYKEKGYTFKPITDETEEIFKFMKK